MAAALNPRQASRGFTLLEVLVVVFVVAVMAGLAVMQLGSRDRDRELQTEAMRLTQVLELARQEAVLSVDELALELSRDRDVHTYGFIRFDPASGRWEPLTGSPWQAHRIAEGIGLELQVEDRSRGPEVFGSVEEGRRPALLILSSGELTPFRLDLVPVWDSASWRLESDGFGTVRATRDPS